MPATTSRLGKSGEAGLLAPGLGFEHFLDLLEDERDTKAGLNAAGTPRTIEGPLYVIGAAEHRGFASDHGFLFGSVNPDVQPLQDYPGGAKTVIDMVADQSDEGLEVLRGGSTYTYAGKGKLQAENGADGYHVSAVHWNYVATVQNRTGSGNDKVKAVDASKWAKQKGGFYSFENGHLLLWTTWADPTNRPLYPRRDELVAKFGEAKADCMIGYLRNLCLYPNLFLMDQFSTQLRVPEQRDPPNGCAM